jgi:hypothetical protein
MFNVHTSVTKRRLSGPSVLRYRNISLESNMLQSGSETAIGDSGEDMNAVPVPEALPQSRREAEKSTDRPAASYLARSHCKTEDSQECSLCQPRFFHSSLERCIVAQGREASKNITL